MQNSHGIIVNLGTQGVSVIHEDHKERVNTFGQVVKAVIFFAKSVTTGVIWGYPNC